METLPLQQRVQTAKPLINYGNFKSDIRRVKRSENIKKQIVSACRERAKMLRGRAQSLAGM